MPASPNMAERRAHKRCKEWLTAQMDGEPEVWMTPAFQGKRRVDVLGWWDGVQAVGEVECVPRGSRRRCHVEIYDFKSSELLDRLPCDCDGCS